MNSNLIPPYQNYQIPNSGNPNNNFSSIVTGSNRLQNMNASNLTDSFSNVKSVIQNPDYRNGDNMMHNNIKKELLKEVVQEYQLFIDSKDRDKDVYTNPFSFILTFSPQGDSMEKNSLGVNTLIKGDPRPHISIDFKNVKYLRIDNLILPQYIEFLKQEPVVDKIKVINKLNNNVFDIEAIYSKIMGIKGYVNKSQIVSSDLQTELTILNGTHNIFDIDSNHQYYFDTTVNKWFVYTHNKANTLYNDKYIILRIKELETTNLGTNTAIDNAFGIIYPDKIRSSFFTKEMFILQIKFGKILDWDQ